MNAEHIQALETAVERAKQDLHRLQRAAEKTKDPAKKTQQNIKTATAAAGVADLEAAVEKAKELLASRQQPHVPEGADHPFAAYTYPSDTGPIQTYHMTVEDRLRVVPKLDAGQCEAALRVPNLQTSVRKALERRLRALAKEAQQ